MKKYKFITISETGRLSGSHPQYTVTNNGGGYELARLCWYAPWRQYVLEEVDPDAVFNNSCLRDILDFMEKEAK